MAPKKLEEKSQFSDLDVDKDGVVSDHELSIVEAHDAHRKYKTQERIKHTLATGKPLVN